MCGVVAVCWEGVAAGSVVAAQRVLAVFLLFGLVALFFNRGRLAGVTLKQMLLLQGVRLALGSCALLTGGGAPDAAVAAQFLFDALIGAFALAVVVRPVLRHRELLFAWNLVGAFELCSTFAEVARSGGGQVGIGVVAAVLAPVLLVGHVLIGARLFRNQFWERDPVRKPMPDIASAFVYTPALPDGGNA